MKSIVDWYLAAKHTLPEDRLRTELRRKLAGNTFDIYPDTLENKLVSAELERMFQPIVRRYKNLQP